MKISFSNFSQDMSESDIEKVFQAYGTPSKFNLKKDKLTKKSLGYGTLEMDDSSGQKAIDELDGKEIQDKKVSVGNWDELQAKLAASQKNQSSNNNNSGGKVFGRSTPSGGGGTGIQRRGGNRGS